MRAQTRRVIESHKHTGRRRRLKAQHWEMGTVNLVEMSATIERNAAGDIMRREPHALPNIDPIDAVPITINRRRQHGRKLSHQPPSQGASYPRECVRPSISFLL